jgi:phage anti-repressor protein
MKDLQITTQVPQGFNFNITHSSILDCDVVTSRELYLELKGGKDDGNYDKWIKKLSRFTKGEDYIEQTIDILSLRNLYVNSKGGRKRKNDFYLTIDTAKNMAMSTQSEMGMNIRRYFIAMEKVARQLLVERAELMEKNLVDNYIERSEVRANYQKLKRKYAKLKQYNTRNKEFYTIKDYFAKHSVAQPTLPNYHVFTRSLERISDAYNYPVKKVAMKQVNAYHKDILSVILGF